MKMGQEHKVPLTDEMVALLGTLPKDSEWLFPSRKPGLSATGSIGETAFRDCLHKMGRPDVRPHGFRGMMQTYLHDHAGTRKEVTEAMLAHAKKGKVEKAYDLATYFKEGRIAQAKWTAFCCNSPVEKVVQLRG